MRLTDHSTATAELRQRVRLVVDDLLPWEKDFLQRADHNFLMRLNIKREEVRRLGLWGLSLPRELGGHGLPLHEFAGLAEEMGRSPLAHYVFGCQAPEAGNIELLHHFASPEQKALVLTPLLLGQKRSCFAMTERQASGANPTLLKTQAELQKDGWVINGEKWFTTAADGADFCIVMAISDAAAAPHERASLYLLPMDQAGLHLVRSIPVMGHTGVGPFSHCELRFDSCRLPLSSLLGRRGEGFRMAQTRLAHGRIHHCARWIGIAQRALEMLCERSQQRMIGEDRRLSDSDMIQSWIGEAAADIAAARLFVRHTALLIDEQGSAAARSDISMIKYFVAQVLSKVLDHALQAYGAAGVSDDFILAYFYREERASRIYDGPDEVHKLAVARRLLKAYEPSSDPT